jgi:co-chaperonin GroES (HSP10)
MIKCFGKNVMVTPIDLECKNKSGSLFLPELFVKSGQVVCFGGDVDVAIELHDIVYFDERYVKELMINNEKHMIMEESDILYAFRDE